MRCGGAYSINAKLKSHENIIINNFCSANRARGLSIFSFVIINAVYGFYGYRQINWCDYIINECCEDR